MMTETTTTSTDTDTNTNTSSPIQYVLGIDEAGRGPVLGPMVYGACLCKTTDVNKVKKLGVADSKTLKDETRDSIFRQMKQSDYVHHFVEISSPSSLSQKMLKRNKYNLNLISHDHAISLIQRAIDFLTEKNDQSELTEVFIDTVGDPAKYQEKLEQLFPSLDITVSKKADALFPVVSAASIAAKVTRDRLLSEWNFTEKGLHFHKKFGSGYPGDGVTKQWLRDHIDPIFGFPDVVRFSWATTQNMLQETPGVVSIEWSDEDDDDSNYASASAPTKRKKIQQSKTPTNTSIMKRKRTDYFVARNIELVDQYHSVL